MLEGRRDVSTRIQGRLLGRNPATTCWRHPNRAGLAHDFQEHGQALERGSISRLIVHGSVQVERSYLQALRVIERRYVLLAHEGSLPRRGFGGARRCLKCANAGGMQRGRASGPPCQDCVTTRTSCKLRFSAHLANCALAHNSRVTKWGGNAVTTAQLARHEVGRKRGDYRTARASRSGAETR